MIVRAILFDLDGTLVQTREAAWELFRKTDREIGLGISDRNTFFALFEDNFFRALARHCRDAKKSDAAKQHFLRLLRTQYCPKLIPGMTDVIKALANRCTLAVLSTNAMQAIRRILTEAGVAHCFAHVFAGDVEPDKANSIHRFVADHSYTLGRHCTPAYDERTESSPVSTDEIVLVTDTVGDVIEARKSGIRAIGVAWGMHPENKLLAAGAAAVAVWPQELIAWLAPEAATIDACVCRAEGAGSPPIGPVPMQAGTAVDSCVCGTHDHTAPLNSHDVEPITATALEARLQGAADIRRQRRLKAYMRPNRPGSRDGCADASLLRAVGRIRCQGPAIALAGRPSVAQMSPVVARKPVAEVIATLAKLREAARR
jgi:phosphoglycolate phosphatase